MKPSQEPVSLDPYSAEVGFTYENIGGGCHGRVYYWYDPEGHVPTIEDHEFRQQHPDISDESWRGLLHDAFMRGEHRFASELPWA
ncbi:MAG: hypothetical protein QOJ13_940 [Gaiellales bacterium]|jgi:hypothetical protein|nr:hypothetical protein [Gaiellales bacterium]